LGKNPVSDPTHQPKASIARTAFPAIAPHPAPELPPIS